ncbi:MAG: Nramp family divalent metal transporter [Phycisphaerales bacterium]|nr:Nramp family divalent metal transporter [Phycisphaerales bacterium]
MKRGVPTLLNYRGLMDCVVGTRTSMRTISHPAIWTAMRSVSLGLLVAAAGIGGSDVSMAALTGSRFGLMLLWAIVAGAFIKFVLNEGVARWQVATGETFLEGTCHRLGPAARIVFLIYLLPWTFSVGASVMSASAAVAAAALTAEKGWVASGTSETSGSMRVLLGLGHSLAAGGLVLSGGYAVFKRVMGVLTIAMVLLVVVAAVLTRPDLSAVAGAIFVPRLPREDPEGVQWTIALFGGIGGTVTMLAYGYWMREEGRTKAGDQPSPRAWSYRIDLGIAYTVTVVFGIALTIVSADVPVYPSGANLFQAVASRLAETIDPVAGWVYLAGAWCAVCACMLGVWQFIPLLFADFVSRGRAGPDAAVTQTLPERLATKDDLSRTPAYRAYLLGLATLPALGVWLDFAVVQRAFGILGSMFIPLLALALLMMNNRRAWVGRHVNGFLTNAALVTALAVATMGLIIECARLLGW